jgi:hypothetical protein
VPSYNSVIIGHCSIECREWINNAYPHWRLRSSSKSMIVNENISCWILNREEAWKMWGYGNEWESEFMRMFCHITAFRSWPAVISFKLLCLYLELQWNCSEGNKEVGNLLSHFTTNTSFLMTKCIWINSLMVFIFLMHDLFSIKWRNSLT